MVDVDVGQGSAIAPHLFDRRSNSFTASLCYTLAAIQGVAVRVCCSVTYLQQIPPTLITVLSHLNNTLPDLIASATTARVVLVLLS